MKIINYNELTQELAAHGCAVIDMPNDAYHAWPAISKSGLDLINRSPAHYRYGTKREATRAMEIGTAIHTALLEPERFAAEYVLLRDVADRRASEYKQAVAAHGSERVLVSHEADSVAGMQESVRNSTAASSALSTAGWRELSMFATCPVTGALVKCRFDILTEDGNAYDLKKTQDARQDAFSRTIANYRYHVQAAFYSYVYALVTGRVLQTFSFIVVEQEPPHCAAVYALDSEATAQGKAEAMADLTTYAECVASGVWGGYDEANNIIGLPHWAIIEPEFLL